MKPDTTRLLRPVIVLFIFGALVSACTKSGTSSNDSSAVTQSNQSASSENQAEAVSSDVINNVMGVNADCGLGNGIGIFVPDIHNVLPWQPGWEHCFTATIDPLTLGVFPKTVTIDFGTGCTGIDGHIRKGKVITVYTGPLSIVGSIATTTFQNFYFDSLHVEGTHVISNISTVDNRIFTAKLQDGKITGPHGGVVECNRMHTWTQTEGNNTLFIPLDDVFAITGGSQGSFTFGDSTVTWTTEVIQPIVRHFTCPWRESGQIKCTGEKFSSVLDYGNGDCDNKATLTVNGNTINVILWE
jgi:hypothetical protein